MRIPSGVTDQYVYFVAVDATDFTTRETGLALTDFTAYRSRNGGTATVMGTLSIIELSAANMPGVYGLLANEDMTIAAGNQSEEMAFHITHASMAPVTRTIELYRPSVTAGETLGVSSGGATAVNVTSIASGTIAAADFAPGAVNAAAIATGAIGAAELATDAVNEIRDAVIAALGTPVGADILADIATLQGDTDDIQTRLPAALVSGRMDSDVAVLQTGVINAAALAANAITNAAMATNAIDNLNLAIGTITAGTFAANAIAAAAINANAITSAKIATDAIGNAQIAADAIGSSELATTAVNEIRDAVIAALGTPAGPDLLADIAALQSDTDDLQTRLPAALVGGAMDSDVSAIQANVIAAAAIAADAITAAKLAADVATEINAAVLAVLPAALTSTGKIDADVGAINTSLIAAIRLGLSAGAIIPGTVSDDSIFPATVTEFEAADITEDTDNHYNGRLILFVSGDMFGQMSSVTTYTFPTSNRGHFLVVGLTEAPPDGSEFIIL